MATVLVVDDSALDRYLAGALLEEHAGMSVVYAEDGRQALAIIQQSAPDAVLTDMQMPEMNGLELVEAVRRDFPSLPVILMTAHGSEEIAVEALQKGAASYVPKRNLARDLAEVIENVLTVTGVKRNQQMVLDCLAEVEARFVLANDAASIPPLIGHLQDQMTQMKICDKGGLIRIGTALHEVLVNAIEHGNLELSSDLRETGDRRAYLQLAEERRQQPPYRDRRVHITVTCSHEKAVYVVRDEGPGFDPSLLPDPTDPANLERSTGRGLLLIRTFMDEVSFNQAGNEITMVKRRK